LLVIYQNELDSLLDQLQEWKKVGTLLQDLRMNIVLLRSNSFPLSRLKSPLAQRQRRKILREIKIAWQICNRTLHKLKDLAINVHAIGEPYDPETGSGPDWFLSIQRSAAEIDKAVLAEDIVVLLDILSAFGTQVDSFLYRANKNLHYVTSRLQAPLLAASRVDVRDEYAESSQQIKAYLNEFVLLGKQFNEWLEIHGLLQDFQINFALCRSYASPLSRFAPSARRQRERMLYEVEVEWRSCKRVFGKLGLLAASIRATGEPYEPDTGSGPDWFLVIQSLAAKIDKALLAEDPMALPEHLSAFGDQIDRLLYLTDKALSDVSNKINRLPRPNFGVRS